MGISFSNSKIWQRHLAARPDDEFTSQRERLRNAFEAMRRNVEPLVAAAHKDCDGLTVHDISHLDALWHTASIISGDDFDMTPAEAFVLGGAILLHDAGMAYASYKGGIDEIRNTPEWLDAFASMKGGSSDDGDEALSAIKKAADFQALRRLHAAKAESLAVEAFPSAVDDNVFYLIEDQQVRLSYGNIIGQIAHSHHWDIDQLKNLPENIGAMPSLPQNWIVNSIKIAALLRCADAAHIDSDRAPSMLFSLVKPKGLSFHHWNFQNNILQPQVVSKKLVFSSSRPFPHTDADSWWLSYETARMIDYEISSSCALLKSRNLPVFEVEGVQGTETPSIFSSYIRTKNWIPINTEIKVSNPSYVAAMLGGKNLYGDNPFISIREMIQNASDAIRARRIIDKNDKNWGKISIDFWKDKLGKYFISVSDNGIGMSERTLTGPLIDFGKSSWSSASMQDEFPGLLSEGYRPTGKFGIGFFSTFMLGGEVVVISRRYDEGADKSRKLTIPSLEKRPILTNAISGEIDTEVSTKISVNISDKNAEILLGNRNSENNSAPIYHTDSSSIEKDIRKFIANLDINVEYNDSINNIIFSHKADWMSYPKANIVANMNGLKELSPETSYLAELFDFIHDKGSGEIVGFATLPIVRGALSVGSAVLYNGLSYGWSNRSRSYAKYRISPYPEPSYVGVMPGEIIDAARQTTKLTLSDTDVSEWATKIGKILSSSYISPVESMHACHQILNFKGDPENLFFCYSSGKFINYEEFINKIKNLESINIPLTLGYSTKLTAIDELSANYFTDPLVDGVFCISLYADSFDFMKENEGKEIKDNGWDRILEDQEIMSLQDSTSISIIFDPLKSIWGNDIEMVICKTSVFEPTFLQKDSNAWVLRMSKKKV